MARRLVYLITAILLGVTTVFAVAWSEARVAFIALASAEVVGAWWLTKRQALSLASVWELRSAAAASLAVGIVLAVLIPSTRILCDCPFPAGATSAFVCNCPVDRHMVLRAALAFGGFLIGLTLAMVSRRRVQSHSVTPGH
jgi:hypothetical protein